MVSMLNRLLWRDLWHLRGQVIAAALVMACGVSTLIGTRSTYVSLLQARDHYYASQRFADVFVHLKRAPDALVSELRGIAGVSALEARIVMDVTADVRGLPEPAVVRMVSIPTDHPAALNAVQLLRGRPPDPHAKDEVIVSDAFATAHGLQIGDRVGATLNGRRVLLSITGVGLSPEFVYEVGSGMLLPDNRRFGVMWMPHDALAPVFDMLGGFNDLVLSLSRDAHTREVIDALDRQLRRYGGLGAHGRDEQLSHRFLSDELDELAVMTSVLPALFLAVSGFLVYAVLSRLVATQRTQIGLLKAFGVADRRVALHYLGFALGTATLGLLLGHPLGLGLAALFVDTYREYFRFPELALVVRPDLLITAAGISLSAAAAGALMAVGKAARLPPAQAMQPAPPKAYRAWGTWGTRPATAMSGLSASSRMILRNLARTPSKAGLSVLGIACAIGLMLVGRFATDASTYLMSVQFGEVQRENVTVLFATPRGPDAIHAMARLPGVLRAEPFRAVAVWLRHEHRGKRVEILGLRPPHQLRRLLDRDLNEVPLPEQGLVLADKLARTLGVRLGDVVSVEVLEGSRPTRPVQVTGVVDELLGLGAYMDSTALTRLLGEDTTSSGTHLHIDDDARTSFLRELKGLPIVGGIAMRDALLRSLQDTLDRSFLFVSAILLAFACVIVGGTLYNSARIALSERGHELASLSVLGFTQREVTVLLLGEQAILVAMSIPAGLALGWVMCAILVPLFDRELFRLPLVLGKGSMAYAAAAAIGASCLSGLLVVRRIRALDLIAVLKTRE